MECQNNFTFSYVIKYHCKMPYIPREKGLVCVCTQQTQLALRQSIKPDHLSLLRNGLAWYYCKGDSSLPAYSGICMNALIQCVGNYYTVTLDTNLHLYAEEGGHDITSWRKLACCDDIPRARIMDASYKDYSMDQVTTGTQCFRLKLKLSGLSKWLTMLGK